MMIGPNNSQWTEFEAGGQITDSNTHVFKADTEILAGGKAFLTVAEGTPASKSSNPNNYVIAKKEGDNTVYVPYSE